MWNPDVTLCKSVFMYVYFKEIMHHIQKVDKFSTPPTKESKNPVY